MLFMRQLRLREILTVPAAAAILLFACGIPSAHASYIVSSYATTSTGGVVFGTACYNYCGSTGAAFATGLGGQAGAVATATGTTDTTGLLFSSFDSAFQSDPDTGFGVQSGSGYGAANLATGQLGAATVTNGGGVTSGGLGEFSDVVHYAPPGATATTVTDVTVNWMLDGTMSATAPGNGLLTWVMSIGNFGLTAYIYDGPHVGPGCAVAYTPCIEGGTPTLSGSWVSTSFSSDTAGNINFTGVFALTGTSFNLPVSAELYSDFGGGATGATGPTNADYSHTATFGFTVPTGTFTSDSGVFLTQQGGPTATPEPGTLALFALGLAGAAALRLRKTRA
jgi:hypothetical protein